ncbi:FAD-binding oxidoreductase [Alteromonas sp. C1M14]|uniref:FAD-binding oxidoreductase n=1 Tax=Alteromonas sp. C1M14 TaxID=2841567 RepID=UPI001C09DC8B|nr:FAD-binding oxidoreductase [Alteromonas sp. C1M14]MBU2980021.1 FAD-binding oxidoreductase [Alteromonas sp. C1M14]
MDELIQQLIAVVGNGCVTTDPVQCRLYTTDVANSGKPALAVVQPTNSAQLSEVVKIAHRAGVCVVPRGGGMSYTSGYLPTQDNSLLIDTSKMQRIVEINTQDMYVTVEAGCTWSALYDALKETPWRTPFWGTLSGLYATVGGGLSQNCIFWGATQFGSAAESVVSMSVVLADGQILHTGSASHVNGNPWYRQFGPDLTGLFVGDCGALGFKATITLKLLPQTPFKQGLSFSADNADDLLAFAGEVARQQLAAEVFGFDPFLQGQRLKRESLGKDLKALKGVMKSAGGLGAALKAGAKVALAGRSYMKDVKFSIHTMVEERYQAVADSKAQALRELAVKFNLTEIENSIPTIMRANPFGPVNSMIGPQAERWLPVHGVLRPSQAAKVFAEIEAIYAEQDPLIQQHNIGCGFLFAAVGTNGIVIEPVYFWPDSLNDWHREAVESEHLAKLKEYAPNPEARAAVQELKQQVLKVFKRHGALHMQLGKSYPYKDIIRTEAWDLVSAIKQHLDPTHSVNPGTLGLE